MKKKSKRSNTIFLPTTEFEFLALIHKLMKKYKLPSEEHAIAVVANRIQHLPPDQATCTLDYLGHSVLKNIAYQVAQSQSKRIQHKTQVDELLSILKNNPLDQQARDFLQKAANEGSLYAQAALSEVIPADDNVAHLHEVKTSCITSEDSAEPQAVSSEQQPAG